MASKVRYEKLKVYPRPHRKQIQYCHDLEPAGITTATIIPVIGYDEGLGAPSTYNANPEHASFATTDEPQCFPESRVNTAFIELTFSLTKHALETDKVTAVRCAYMPITHSFEDISAEDELTSATVGSIIELQKEDTDRQCYPLWNGSDMINASDIGAQMPGLTTDEKIEGVTFSTNTFYNALAYYTNAGKIRDCVGGMKWITLTRQRPVFKTRIKVHPKGKRMVPYSFTGIMTHVPSAGNSYQLMENTDTTSSATANGHVQVSATIQYHEWNLHFDMEKV